MALELRIIRDPCRDLVKHRSRLFGPEGGSIGRSPDCFWVLPDPDRYISAHHCSIECVDGEYWLRDTSRNGVFLNDATEPVGPVQKVPLRTGDRIRVAGYEFAVKVHERFPQQASADVQESTAHAEAQPGSTLAEPSPGRGMTDTMALPPGSSESLDLGHETIHRLDAYRPDPPSATSELASRAESPNSLYSNAVMLVESAINRIKQLGPERSEDPIHRFRSGRQVDFTGAAGDSRPPTFIRTTIDPIAMEQHCILLGLSDQTALRGYKILRTRLRRRLSANQWRSVGITGEGQGVGKTVTAINLAVAFAQDARTPVILVDLDLHRPSVGTYLGMSYAKGLSEYLLGEASIEEIIYSPGVQGLAIVPSTRPLSNASELLASPRMAELVRYLEALSPRHIILYDLPPLLMSDDVLVFSPQMDCVLDVVAVGVTPRAALERSKEVLSELNVIGVVVNRAAEDDQAGHHYYY